MSQDADAIIRATLVAEPAAEARAVLVNTLEQLSRFASGDGLNPWPAQVSHEIEHDFSAREAASYASAKQQTGVLSVPPVLAHLHLAVALAGVMSCMFLLPIAFIRRAPCAGFLVAVLIALPVSAAITGSLSAPHDRYQSRIMWLPPFIAVVSLASLRRRERSAGAAVTRSASGTRIADGPVHFTALLAPPFRRPRLPQEDPAT